MKVKNHGKNSEIYICGTVGMQQPFQYNTWICTTISTPFHLQGGSNIIDKTFHHRTHVT